MNNTLYAVYKQGRVVASGSLNQCWMFLYNTEDANLPALEIAEKGIYIAPFKKRGK